MEFSSGTPTLDLSRLGNECLYLTLVSNKSGARGCHSVDERPQVSLPVPQKQNNQAKTPATFTASVLS